MHRGARVFGDQGHPRREPSDRFVDRLTSDLAPSAIPTGAPPPGPPPGSVPVPARMRPWEPRDIEAITAVQRLYRLLLGRVADSGGLARFVSMYESSGRVAVIDEMVASPEFRARPPAEDERVRRLVLRLETEVRLVELAVVRGDVLLLAAAYEVLLGREPETAGFLAYYRQLLAGTNPRRVVRSIARSAESRAAGSGAHRRLRARRGVHDRIARSVVAFAAATAGVTVADGADGGAGAVELALLAQRVELVRASLDEVLAMLRSDADERAAPFPGAER